jgi:predicted nucleic acid-binding protein
VTVFVDTSSLFVFLDADDGDHADVSAGFEELCASDAVLVTTNYVVVETLAVCQRRLGIEAARNLVENVVPLMDIQWVTPEAHWEAVNALLAANRRDLSFVDCVSFEVMRRLGIRRAFALDEHFRERGFEVVP